MFQLLSTLEIAAMLLARVKRHEIPPVWCNAGRFSILGRNGDLVPLKMTEAHELAVGKPEPVNATRLKTWRAERKPVQRELAVGLVIRGRVVRA